jgi:type I restriction enzyme, S subunit
VIGSRVPLVRLGYLATIQSGVTVDGKRDQEADSVTLPYLRVANVQDGHLDLGTITEIRVPKTVARSVMLRHGDVLMTEGGDLDKLGRGTVWNSEIGNCLHQNHVFAVRPDRDKLMPEYLALITQSAYARAYFESTGTKTTNLASTSSSKIRDFRIPFVDLDEQRRIVDFLDAETARIDQIIEARRRSRHLIHEKTFATICNLTTFGSGPSERTDDPWIPIIGAGWEVLPLKRRWRIIDCKHRTPQYIENGYPVISPGDITAGRLDPSVAHRFVDELDYRDLADNLRRARRGDIVYGRNASVGVAAFVDSDEKFTMGQDVCRITSPHQDQLFLAYFLNSAALAQLGSIQIGSTFTRVNISTLLELRVACPPLEEQQRLAAVMDLISREAEQAMSAIDKQLSLLTERRQALITAAVTGGMTV